MTFEAVRDRHLVRNDDPEKPYRLDVYDLKGRRIGSAPFELAYTGFSISGGNILVWDPGTVLVFSPRGRETARIGIEDFSVSNVTGDSLFRQLIVAGASRMMKIRLK